MRSPLHFRLRISAEGKFHRGQTAALCRYRVVSSAVDILDIFVIFRDNLRMTQLLPKYMSPPRLRGGARADGARFVN